MTTQTAAPARRADRTPRSRLALGALAGVVSTGLAVGLAELVSALLTGVTSPLVSVANRVVDQTPQALKEFAIETFGEADKVVLIGTVIAVVALLVAVAGAVGVRRPRVAAVAFVVLVVVATAAAVTDRVASASVGVRLVPGVLMLVAGIGALAYLLGLLRTPDPRAAAAPAEHGSPTDPPVHRGPEDKGELSQEDGRTRLALPSHVPALPAAFDRRRFMVAAAAVSAAAAAAGGLSRVLGTSVAGDRASLSLPAAADGAGPVPAGADFGIDGLTSYITPNGEFYRVDTALQLPQVPIDTWSLRIHGMVDREVTLTYQDLLDMDLVERRITLTCVSNPVGGELVGNAQWLGVLTRDVLAMAGVQAGADAVLSTSADDMTIITPTQALTDDRGSMIAIGMNGEPLPVENGFPVRMVTPGVYGYVGSTKWLVDLEVGRFQDLEAYWTPRGYAEQAPIKLSSRIDVPRSFARLQPGRNVVAGVAWSQTIGITRVEVQVDDGPWQEAELAADDNVNTWRQWRYEWDAEPGNHTITVRATDASGETQTQERAPIAPDGSTGWHNLNVTVEG